MAKYRKRPVVIEAFQLPTDPNADMGPFHAWAEEHEFENYYSDRDGALVIATLEGDMTANPGDFIVKGVVGEFYAVASHVFEKTYEAV